MSDVEEKSIENAAEGSDVQENGISEEKALKDEMIRFMSTLSDSSVRNQIISYSSITKSIDRADSSVHDLVKMAVKGLVKSTVTTAVQRYEQPKSFQVVGKLLDALAKHDYPLTVNWLAQTIIAAFPTSSIITDSIALSAIPAAKWMFSLLEQPASSSLSKEGDVAVTSALATLAFCVSASPKATRIFAKKFSRLINADERLKAAISTSIGRVAKENGEKAVCLIAAAASALKVPFVVPVFIETFSRVVLLPKIRPPLHVIEACKPSLAQISEAEFADPLLPNIKKAMLRSPEVAMYGILATLQALKVPLDAYAEDLIKAAIGSTQSTDESLRDTSIALIVALSGRGKASLVAKIVQRLFEQAAAAKTAEQRVSLYQGIAGVARQTTTTLQSESDAVDKIADDVVAKLAKGDKETNEQAVSAQWAAASAWAQRLSKVTPTLVNVFKEANKLAPAVRHIGYRTLIEVMEQKGLTKIPDGVNTKDLWAEAEAGGKGELGSVALALLLLTTSSPDSVEHTKLWSRVAHAESFFKEKFLSSLKWQDALLWCKLVETLVLQRPVVDTKAPPTYSSTALRSFALLLFWPNWKVRRQAEQSLLRVLAKEKALFAEALADVVYTDTVNGNIDNLLSKAIPAGETAGWTVPGEWYVKALRLLLTPTEPEVDKLAIHTLLLASVKRIVELDGSVWIRWMHEQKQAKTWQTSDGFRTAAVEQVLRCSERDVRDTALIALVALNVEPVREALWRHVETSLAELDVHEYARVTDKQIAVYRCAEGHLFNTDVLDFDEGEGMHNMKRENKAYSHASQIAEIELKRELAEKRRKEGKLTAKQKQVMEKELASEKVIRDELKKLHRVAEHKLDEARALVAADNAGAFARPRLLFDCCLPLTKCSLVAREAALLFLAYRHAAFEHTDDHLDELVGSSWLRVVGSRWLLDAWKDEPLDAALKRMFSLLNERAFFIDTGDDDGDAMNIYEDVVGASQLTLLYPMIKVILTDGKYGDAARNDVLQLLQNAVSKTFLKDNAVLDLPMEQYASLLLDYNAKKLSAPAFKALCQLMSLANETEDVGARVTGMIREALAFLAHDNHDVRLGAVQVLAARQLLTRVVLTHGEDEIARDVLVRLFVARHDPEDVVADAASQLWADSLFHVRPFMGHMLVDECVSEKALVRDSASRAVFSFVERFADEMPSVLEKIDAVYGDLSELRGAVFDDVGRQQRDAVDEWQRRSGVAATLVLLAGIVREQDAERLIKIVVPLGIVDRNDACRNAMRNAAVETIRRHGAAIMPRLSPFLEELSDKTPAGAAHDNRRQGLIVLLGTLAQYIDPTSGKVAPIVSRLVEELSTPSQTVQKSVSLCLAPLVPAIREGAKALVAKLQFVLFEADSYGQRRGAAFGIAGLIKGLGMLSLKDMDLLTTVQTYLADKKSQKHREGSLLALEILCSTIGKLFEPYIIKALPSLLVCFGDSDDDVRRAAEDTAKAMMASMSVYGTKLILPSLLAALDEDSWRTKCAATELLGSMAWCAPRQLSSCLPSIVPKLIEVLADSSSKVQKSGEKALRQIAGVVRNPEILGVTNQLMTGLLDPANKTSAALQAVLNTKFIHYIDAPSLALMMPIVRRAFEDRNSETRRVAAQIIANIYTLTENKDMEPYLLDLVPGLQRSLLDPVPEIRTVSARALGAIISKAGGRTSDQLKADVIPWLKEKLVSPMSTVDRSGAAQGLCEVLAGSDAEHLSAVMPEIIAATESPDVPAETRDGYILMYIYLPMVFGEKFIPYLPRVVPPILKALADENEYVRTSALKAGQRLITQYCSHARKLLLPQLQKALLDDNWRIRYASVQLVGDFLFQISGVSGKSTTATADEDDTMGIEQVGKAIIRALGQKDRDRVLAAIYLVRADIALLVRQAATHVWKIVVSNTPRTLKEVMKHLFEMVVDSLASSCDDRQKMGARCLGELVRKMGDRVIVEVLPVLEANQDSEDPAKRIGVALALYEIIENMSKEVLNHYLSSVVGPVRAAIIDEDPHVRKAAANTFSSLYLAVGNEALDDIIMPLLERLSPDTEDILNGLCEVMRQNSRSMLPYLLPKLTKPPVNVHALCSLAAVSGDSLSRQLTKVLDALLAACTTNDQDDPMLESCEKVVIAVTDADGVPVLCDYLVGKAAKGSVPAIVLLHTFIEKSGNVLTDLAESLLPDLLQLYLSKEPQIVDHAIQSAILLTKPMSLHELQTVLPVVKKSLNMVVAAARRGKPVPGFCHPKGIQPLLGMLRDTLTQNTELVHDAKALAIEAFAMVVGAADEAALAPHANAIIGAVVRMFDKQEPHLRLLAMESAHGILDKTGLRVRVFATQLRTTFMKVAQDPNSRAVRLAAGGGLSRLIPLLVQDATSASFLVRDLLTLIATSPEPQFIESWLPIVTALLMNFPKEKQLVDDVNQLVASTAEGIYNTPLETPSELENSITAGAGAMLGQIVVYNKDWQRAKQILGDVESPQTKPRARLAKAVAVQQMCKMAGDELWAAASTACRSAMMAAFGSADVPVACSMIRAAAYVLLRSLDRELLSSVARAINHQSLDVRKTTAIALGHVGQTHQMSPELLKVVVPQLVNGTKESNSALRSAAELALVHVFKFADNVDAFEAYHGTAEGAAQRNLDDVRVVMGRVVRSGDLRLEAINNILEVP